MKISAALVSVGGSPAPILHVLRQHRPAHVWYFCSAGSRAIADAIHTQLDWPLDRDFIEAECFEELGSCYRELRHAIPALLKKWKVPSGEVLVDYTGGTKTMSAALVLAASEVFQQFSYVGGDRRDKDGLGAVADGAVQSLSLQPNPWLELATREVERACDLWAGCQFDVAAKVLRAVAPRVPHRLRFEAIAGVADGMASRHRLDFREAVKTLGIVSKQLPALFDGKDDAGLRSWMQATLQICTDCAKDSVGESVLRELLDNTLRTAAQGRFEDAAARLYRAMEMQGQLWLARVTDDLFLNGKCRLENSASIPDALKALPFCQPNERKEIKLSLEQLYVALAALGHARAKLIIADLDATDAVGKTKSRWRAITEKRNTSILAHGVQPIGENGFSEMKQRAVEFLGFELDQEANPILRLDPQWL